MENASFRERHPFIFWGIIIVLILVIAFLFFGLPSFLQFQIPTSTPATPVAPVITDPTLKAPADLTDDDLMTLWKGQGCLSHGTIISNPTVKAFWRGLGTVALVQADMKGWKNSIGKATANMEGCLGPAKSGCQFDARAPGYDFCQDKDSNLNDIRQDTANINNVSALVSTCDLDPTCAGFNSNGFLKKTIVDPSGWVSAFGNDNTKGLFVKKVERFYGQPVFKSGRPMMNPFH